MIHNEAIDFNVAKYRTEDDALTLRGMLANGLASATGRAIPIAEEKYGIVFPVRQFDARPDDRVIPYSMNPFVEVFWRHRAQPMIDVAGITDTMMGGIAFEVYEDLGGISIVAAVKAELEDSSRAAVAVELFDRELVRKTARLTD